MKKILAIGIIALLVCGVGLAMAQNQSEGVVASTSLSAVGEKNYTYDSEDDSESITKLRQEIEAQMKEYAWADEIAHGIMIGKYDRPQGAKDYVPPKEPMPRPTPPIPPRPDLMPYFKDFSTPEMLRGIAAGYQVFGGDDKPAYCGRVYGRTNSISSLKDNAKEWHVLHEWGRKNGEGTENCIVVTRNGNLATFGIYVSSLGGYQYWVHHPANHLFSIGMRPEHDDGHREYNEILFWVWDITTNEWWSNTYTLPTTELIYSVDAALEHDTSESPNSLWKSFYEFTAFDENVACVDLKANFGWLEWQCPEMNNEHVEDYYDTYGPNTQATLWQRKTPK